MPPSQFPWQFSMSDSRGVCSHAVGRDHYHHYVEVHMAEWSKPCAVGPGLEPRADTAHAPHFGPPRSNMLLFGAKHVTLILDPQNVSLKDGLKRVPYSITC